ncbi:MAG: hypothetical protein GF398_12710 [Chitinivibrionales bacterium]|nr:hypothetical protein [Chitinivibrionales bacterium]
MKRFLAGLLFHSIYVLLLLCCSGPLTQYYPDSYFREDRAYENKSLGFALIYRGNWDITTDPNRMSKSNKGVAEKFYNSGGELLYVGSTVEGTQGTRGIAINLNLSNIEYARKVREINSESIEEDKELIDFLAYDKPMVKWEYMMYGYQFVEFFFTRDTYNVRVAFWTKPHVYQRFLPVYEEIMSTLTYISNL